LPAIFYLTIRIYCATSRYAEQSGLMLRRSKESAAPGRRALFGLVSVEPVESHRAAGQDALLRLGRGALQALAHHVGGAGKEAVAVRIVGRPHDLVGPDVIGEHVQGAFHRLERDPAIAPEQFARAVRQPAVVETLVVEMPVHAVEPGRDPATARFEETD